MIGIIGAMEEEISRLTSAMESVEIVERASMKFYKGKLSDKEVVIVRSGIGKVNAGICTQILADLFHVDQVINTGIAGSLDAAIDIGDIVLSTDAVQHDMDAGISSPQGKSTNDREQPCHGVSGSYVSFLW